MRYRRLAALCLGAWLWTQPAAAGSFELVLGPEQIGSGGSAPIFIPPVDPFQWAATWVTDGGFETMLSLCPGLVVGQRFKSGGLFVSLGGGLIIDANGSGGGVYSTLGYESGGGSKGWHFIAEYTQGLGYKHGGYLAPSATRFGVIWEY